MVIARNEEKKIGDCLLSLAFCDERIVIDSGSTDSTVQVSKKYHTTVFTHNTDDFSALRNYGLQKARGEWLLYIDADERVSKELADSILREIKSPRHDAYHIKRKNFYFYTHEWPVIEELERLFRRHNLIEWYGRLHESPRIKGSVGTLDGYVFHFTHDNLAAMVRKTNEWSDTEAKTRFERRHPRMSWWRFFRVMLSGFSDSYFQKGGWRTGTAGLIESIFQAYSMFITYAKLWELQNHRKKS